MRIVKAYIFIFMCFISSSVSSSDVVQTKFYKLLEVKPSASMNEIKKAYRRKAQKVHPDKFQNKPQEEIDRATQAFQILKDIYEILSDPVLREKYNTGKINEVDYFKEWKSGFEAWRDSSASVSEKEKTSSDSVKAISGFNEIGSTSDTASNRHLFYSKSIHPDNLLVDAIYIDIYMTLALHKEQEEDFINFLTTKIIVEHGTDTSYLYRGIAYAQLNRHTEAIRDFTESIKVNPQAPKAYANRGRSHATLGEFDKAITDFNTAIELEPQYAVPYGNRGIVHYVSENYKQAIRDLTTYLELEEKEDSFISEILLASERRLDRERMEAIRAFFKRCASFFSGT